MICRRCGQDKVSGDFIWKSSGAIAHGQKCKSCLKELRDDPEEKLKTKSRSLKYQYGISLEDYQILLEKQNGVCAICGKKSDATGKNATLHVDHDHDTNEIRGLLCYGCNIAMGFLSEDLERIYKIIDYLNQHPKIESEIQKGENIEYKRGTFEYNMISMIAKARSIKRRDAQTIFETNIRIEK